jgi:hypothetical protein
MSLLAGTENVKVENGKGKKLVFMKFAQPVKGLGH